MSLMDELLKERVEQGNRGVVMPKETPLTAQMKAGLVEIQKASASRPVLEAQAQNPRTMEEGINFVEVQFDLTELVNGPKEFKVAGVEILYKKQGSNPAGRVTFVAGGRVQNMTPGTRIRHTFGGFQIESTPTTLETTLFNQAQETIYSANVGKAVFVIIKRVGYDYVEPEIDQLPAQGLFATYFSATEGGTFNDINVPAGANAGIPIDGCSGVRVMVTLEDDTAIQTAEGTIQFWFYDPFVVSGVPRWTPGPVTEIIPATWMTNGITSYVSLDYPVAVGYGRIWAQVYGLATDTANGYHVRLYTWNGNG